ncbi:uncharacterized protein LOC124153925 [Ischnura elegans]|uniref:uncharacterized protein LOC124153925 n=1 Tax=Ischnura elegans TaxID=197161 RepID=UPI001ED8A6D8|nr:uncharacterized protein LOC124153925 [Ischnura elegans]
MLPAAVQAGDSATLICLYDLEGAPLYSVKWYKGRREFYRYVPKEVPPTKVFPFPGIVVDLSKSNANQVELQDVQLHLSGNFSCEVSADAPAFSTAFVSEQMTVVDLPDRRPIITLEKSSYAVGQRLEANCTSLRSRPVANLTFYVNDVRVPEQNLVHYEVASPPPPPPPSARQPFDEDSAPLDYGPGTAVQGLRMIVSKADFEGGGGGNGAGSLRLRCVASVLVYHTSAEVVVEEERPKLASVLGAREHHPNGGSARGAATLAPAHHHFSLMVITTTSLIYSYIYSQPRSR